MKTIDICFCQQLDFYCFKKSCSPWLEKFFFPEKGRYRFIDEKSKKMNRGTILEQLKYNFEIMMITLTLA